MSFKTLEQHRKAAEVAGLQAARRQTVAQVYERFPLMTRCVANERAILGLIEQWADGIDVVPSLELFLNALDENPEAINDFAQQPEATIRQQLSKQIVDLLRDKGRAHDNFTLKQEAKRHGFLSLEELRARLADLQVKATMAAIPVIELKRFVADSRLQPQAKVLPESITALQIRSMPSQQIKQLIREFGANAVNERLSGRN